MSKPAKFSIKGKSRPQAPPKKGLPTSTDSNPNIPPEFADDDEINPQEDAKKLQKREYNKRKVRKQRASRKELEIVEDDYMISTDLTKHVSLSKDLKKLSRVKRQKHLTPLIADQEREVMLTASDKEIISKSKPSQPTPPSKKEKGKKLQSELDRALALVNEIADEQEGIIVQKIVREKAKLQYIEEREEQKRQRKEKKDQLKKMMLQHVYTQKKELRRQAKEVKQEDPS